MKPSEILIAARTLLETKGWTQDAMARDISGIAVSCHDPRATCFCALGATGKVLGPNRYITILYGHEQYMYDVFDGIPSSTNDAEDTHMLDVLIAFDFAILMAQDNGD